MIRDHEFKYKAAVGGNQNRFARQAARQIKFNVLLASYEMVRKDKKVFQVLQQSTSMMTNCHH